MRDYDFGNFLHELRLRRGLTQYQLGALVGVSDKAVSKWENGSSKPQSSILYKLSDVLGISADELLTCKYHSFEKRETNLMLSPILIFCRFSSNSRNSIVFLPFKILLKVVFTRFISCNIYSPT